MIVAYSIILVILLVGSIFFSSADMAYGSANLNRLKKDKEQHPKSKNRVRAFKLSKNYDKTISTILLFNDTINAGLDSISTLLGIAIAIQFGFSGDSSTAETFGLVASMLMLVLKIIFGEIIAKSVGKIYNYRIVNWYSMAISVCYYITIPITFLVGGFGQIVTYPVVHNVKDIQIKDDEIHEMIDEGEESGAIDEDKAELLRGTLDFTTTETYEIMTPRARIYAIDKSDKLSDILKDERTFKHSRIPVYEDNIDNIIGYVRTKELIRLKLENLTEDISNIIQNISFFPRTTEINDVYQYFKLNKKHIAIILDEYGGCEGLITLEDIVEEIVGEIWDETDDPNEPYSERNDGTYIVDGGMNLEDFCTLFELDYDQIETEYVTIGGFIIELLDDKFAKLNDVVTYKNLKIKVIALGKHHTVKKLLVEPLHVDENQNENE